MKNGCKTSAMVQNDNHLLLLTVKKHTDTRNYTS